MKPLSRKSRVSLTWFLILLFFVGAPALVLYSTGYRLGSSLSIVKTGGIFIHSGVAGTEVYVNNNFVENNGVILRNTLVQNLVPNKTYRLHVQKDGYHTWVKELFVRPNLVTEAAVLMLPTEVETDEVTEFIDVADFRVNVSSATTTIQNPEFIDVQDLFENPLGQFEVILSTSTQRSSQVVSLDSISGRILTSSTSPITGTTTIFYASTTLPDFIDQLEIPNLAEKMMLKEKNNMLAWLEGGDVHVRWVGREEATPYIFCKEECKEEIIVSLDTKIERYDFLPGRDDILIVHTMNDIFAIEIDNRSAPNIQSIYRGTGLDFRVQSNSTIYVKEGERYFEIIL